MITYVKTIVNQNLKNANPEFFEANGIRVQNMHQTVAHVNL